MGEKIASAKDLQGQVGSTAGASEMGLSLVDESLAPFAERINGHQGTHRCCCDRCAHIRSYVASLLVSAQADTVRLVSNELGSRGFLGTQAFRILEAVERDMKFHAQDMHERAKEYWSAAVEASR